MELPWIAGCQFQYIPALGGNVPIHNYYMETTVKGIYVAGDISGIEEASTAMEEGRLAGTDAAASLGLCSQYERDRFTSQGWERLNSLRCGTFGERRRTAKDEILSVGKEMIK